MLALVTGRHVIHLFLFNRHRTAMKHNLTGKSHLIYKSIHPEV